MLRYLTLPELQRVCPGYDRDSRRLILPVWQGGGVVRWQGRGLEGEPPKYRSGNVEGYRIHDPLSTDGTAPYYGVVITEDILSAWVVTLEGQGSWYGWPALSSSPPAHQLADLALRTSRVLVWLDNDNAQVRRASRRIARDLEGLGVWSVRRVTDLDEPKKVGRAKVREVLA